jgi:NACHT domain
MEDSASSPPNKSSDPSPQIQQNVEGDQNQVIGQVIGGNVFGNIAGNVTIYERVPVSSVPQPASMVPTLTQQEYRQRQVLLDKVKEFWVKSILENSLHSRALIELGLQERLDLVKQPFSAVGEFSDTPGQVLPDGTLATAVFEEMGEGRTLLILGEPGAGKTIALLKLAEDLIVRTAPDLRQQIPVVFNLSSWAKKPQTIEKWLVQELLEKYQVSKTLGETWVKSEALILLLDGLDEVRAEKRNACIQALNLFMQNHGTTEIVVCCRIRDYQVLTDRLMLRSAVCIQPLTLQQVNNYFDQAGEQLSALKMILPRDEVLQELATSPLMLSIMSLAYQDFTPEQLTLGGKTEDYRNRLFATYVDRMFQRRGMRQQYLSKDTKRWLIWLARRITATSQTIFLIERLQLDWLPTKMQRFFCRLGSGLIAGMIMTPYGVMYFGLPEGLSVTLFYVALIGALGSIKTFETFKWSWPKVNDLHSALNSGLTFGLLTTTLNMILENKPFSALPTGLISGLIFGLVILLFAGFQVSDVQKSEKPNHGIFRSARNSAIVGIFIFVIIVLFNALYDLLTSVSFEFEIHDLDILQEYVLKFQIIFSSLLEMAQMNNLLTGGLFFGPILGSFAGLLSGGSACIQHFVLRFILYLNRCTPWNYVRFLDYATERLFLQKIGGGYIFVHRMLLEHFAEMSIEQGKR